MQLFSQLTSLTGRLSTPLNDTLTSNTTIAASVMSSFPVPQEIYSLVTSFLSISAISDWIKLFVVGGALETCRRFLFTWWDGFLETFWLIATIDSGEDACRRFLDASARLRELI